jgi:hypothetical protein
VSTTISSPSMPRMLPISSGSMSGQNRSRTTVPPVAPAFSVASGFSELSGLSESLQEARSRSAALARASR